MQQSAADITLSDGCSYIMHIRMLHSTKHTNSILKLVSFPHFFHDNPLWTITTCDNTKLKYSYACVKSARVLKRQPLHNNFTQVLL